MFAISLFTLVVNFKTCFTSGSIIYSVFRSRHELAKVFIIPHELKQIELEHAVV